VPLSGEEIRRRLDELVVRWCDYAGTERAEAQSFLNELLACYGVDRKEVASSTSTSTDSRTLWPTLARSRSLDSL
jgi:hypothetical protein